jgi:hypothetical protein
MKRVSDAYDAACSKCGAQPGQDCLSSSGGAQPSRYRHVARLRATARLRREGSVPA